MECPSCGGNEFDMTPWQNEAGLPDGPYPYQCECLGCGITGNGRTQKRADQDFIKTAKQKRANEIADKQRAEEIVRVNKERRNQMAWDLMTTRPIDPAHAFDLVEEFLRLAEGD